MDRRRSLRGEDASLQAFVTVVDYGVLGTRLCGKDVSAAAPEPDADTAIVDPAGLQFIQKLGPGQARGASGAIYKWLGIQSDTAFPELVREAIRAPGQAKWHQYGKNHVIHVVGPNLNGVYGTGAAILQTAISSLARAYANTLSQFVLCGASKLRVLPISGGIFAGRFADDIPWMSFKALEKGFDTLPPGTQDELCRRFAENKLEMCVFGSDGVEDFNAGLSSGGEPPAGGAWVLNTLWPGALAMISGLESKQATKFNGTVCSVLSRADGGKYLVELHGGNKATLPSDNIKLADGGALVPGAKVTVDGLQASAGQKFNGTEAMLKAWSQEHGKWIVMLKGGIKANIPAMNLRSVDKDKIDLGSDEWLDLF
jgi:hypothetical protein